MYRERRKTTLTTNHRLAWGLGELAAALGVSLGFIRQQIALGYLPATRIGRRILVLDTELRKFLSSRPERVNVSTHKTAPSNEESLHKNTQSFKEQFVGGGHFAITANTGKEVKRSE